MLIKWILIGPNKVVDQEERRSSVQTTTSVVTQFVMQSVKTNRQVQYPVENMDRGTYQVIETPLSVGMGIVVHQETEFLQVQNRMLNTAMQVPKE